MSLTCEEEIDYDAIEAESLHPIATGNTASTDDGSSDRDGVRNNRTIDEEEEECSPSITELFDAGSDTTEETGDRFSRSRRSRSSPDAARNEVDTRAEEVGIRIRPSIRQNRDTGENTEGSDCDARSSDGSSGVAGIQDRRRTGSPTRDATDNRKRRGSTGEMDVEEASHEEGNARHTDGSDERATSHPRSKILVKLTMQASQEDYVRVREKFQELLREIRGSGYESISSLMTYNIEEMNEDMKRIHHTEGEQRRDEVDNILAQKGPDMGKLYRLNPDGTQCPIGCWCDEWHPETNKETEENIRRQIQNIIDDKDLDESRSVTCPMCSWIIKKDVGKEDIVIRGERQRRRNEHSQYWRTIDTSSGKYYVLFDALCNPTVWISYDEAGIETNAEHGKRILRKTWEETEGGNGQHSIVLYGSEGERKGYVHCLCCPDKTCRVNLTNLEETELHWAELTASLDRMNTYRPIGDDRRARICCRSADEEFVTARNVREQERHPERWIQICCRWIRRFDVPDNSEDETPIASDDEAVMSILDANEYQKELVDELTTQSKNLNISSNDRQDGTTTHLKEPGALKSQKQGKKHKSRSVHDHVEKKRILRDVKLRRSQRLMERELEYIMKKTQDLRYQDDQEQIKRQKRVYAKVDQIRARKQRLEVLEASLDSLLQSNEEQITKVTKIEQKWNDLNKMMAELKRDT